MTNVSEKWSKTTVHSPPRIVFCDGPEFQVPMEHDSDAIALDADGYHGAPIELWACPNCDRRHWRMRATGA